MTDSGFRITYARHALEQMTRRRISRDQVERAIASPSRRYPSTTPPGRLIAERVSEMGNTLRVVYIVVETGQGTDLHVTPASEAGGNVNESEEWHGELGAPSPV